MIVKKLFVLLLISYSLAYSGVVINEFMYDCPGTDTWEWIELYNNDSITAVDLAGWQICSRREGCKLITSDVFFSVAAGGYVVLTKDADAFSTQYSDVSCPVIVPEEGWCGDLYNTTDTLRLKDSEGTIISSVSYDDPCGTGYSFMLDDTTGIWRCSDETNGTPCNPNISTPIDNDLALTWLMLTPSNLTPDDSVGICAVIGNIGQNALGGTISLFFTTAESETLSSEILPIPSLEPSSTDTICMSSLLGPFPEGEYIAGGEISAENDENPENNSRSTPVSIGYLPSIIINEFMYDCTSTDDYEWVELYNGDSIEVVDIAGWEICDNTTCHLITSDQLLIGPGGYLILTQSVDAFFSYYPESSIGCSVVSPEGGWSSLNNTSPDEVILKDNDGTTISSVSYDDPCASGYTVMFGGGVWQCSSALGGTPCAGVPDSDLVLDDVIITPSTPTTESEIMICGVVGNAGRNPISANLTLLIHSLSEAIGETVAIDLGIIDAGAAVDTFCAPSAFGPFPSGEYEIIGELLAGGDENPGNNEQSDTVEIYPPSIIITEVMSDAPGSEDQCPGGYCDEFVELYNAGNDTIDVSGWLIDDGDEVDTILAWNPGELGYISSAGVIYNTTIIPPGVFALILDNEYPQGDMLYQISPSTIILSTNDNNIGNGLSETDPISLLRSPGNPVSPSYNNPLYADDGFSIVRCSLDPEINSWSESPVRFGTPGYFSNILEPAELSIKIDPNPFDPLVTRTKITLNYPKTSRGDVRLYDLKGNLIKSFMDADSDQFREFYWDGKDSRNNPMPIGVYILWSEITCDLVDGCEIKEGGHKTVKKPIVIAHPLK